MRTILKSAFFLIFLCFPVIHLNAQNASGSWKGNIEIPNSKLEVIFNISKNENGELSAKMDVPQQGAAGIPANGVIASSDSLHLKVPSIFGNFSGKFITTDSIAGKWSQGGNVLNLNLKRTGEVTEAKEVKRPQTPKPPFAYTIEEVEYTNPQSELKLAGTLTLPANAKNCPAVILISGSGSQDRDGTIFEQHKSFFVIADYFTRNGIAVLRVDDRGIGGSEGNVSDVTSEDFATDVLCGVNYLKTRGEINKSNIGLIGHSEGGMIAPLAAIRSENVAFIVMMAGPGIPGDSLLIEQTELLLRTSGMPEQRINAQLFVTKGIINILKKEKDSTKRSESMRNAVTGGMYNNMDADRQKMVDGQLKQYDNNWFRFLVSYNPRPTLAKVKCPVLALNGEKDLQVPPKSNLSAIETTLNEGENQNFKTMELPGLNHLFQHCETGMPTEYAQIEETISPEVLEIMKDWILNL